MFILVLFISLEKWKQFNHLILVGCQVNFEESSVICITVNGHCKCYVKTLSESGKRENEIKTSNDSLCSKDKVQYPCYWLIAACKPNPAHHLLLQKCYWNRATLICFRVAYSCFLLQGQSWAVVTETVWLTKLKTFNVWPFKKKCGLD